MSDHLHPSLRRSSLSSRVAVGAALAVLLLVGCSTGGDVTGTAAPATPPAGANAQDGPPAGASGGNAPAGAVEREVVADRDALPATASLTLNRLGDHHLVAAVRFTSEEATGPWDSNLFGFTSFATPGSEYPQEALNGLFWIGPEGRSAHLTYFTEDRSCLCTTFEDSHGWGITREQPVTAAAVLPAPPEGVTELTVFSPFSLPFVDVPIGDQAPDLAAYGITHPDQAPAATPEVFPLLGSSTLADGSETVRENADTTDVELSADVLFALNESTLTPAADEVLARTARRLDADGGTHVEIAGHTDSSGNDAINQPLSERRAETVRAALAQRVGTGVTFTTAGYGSTRPIADNSTPEGARQNRRVTVSFPRPTDTEQSPPTSAPAAPGAAGAGRPMTEFHATVTGAPDYPDAKAELNGLGLERIAEDVVLLSYTMTNLRDSTEDLSPFWTAPSTTALSSLGGTTATDPATGRIYQTMNVDRAAVVREGSYHLHCACTITSAGAMFVPYQETGTLFALLPVPDSVSVLDVNIGSDLVFQGARITG
ncbi:OmpA family protein [Pseudonocardia kunmingensis]|uniref:Outer membrane protein OmpA-like peptidoglycan-associated protein n=1 Tax=Pseudonocardia kunmingensis TaxID=630975 RepID=A0A543CXR2_9PSEU|nr:OmpA family protein [Pseudonocardia kunmingensis]TQM01648.1 outer membrane protein OmpA-like peptidoglycan-associated protein [Pseudonocardia kunmingensis]